MTVTLKRKTEITVPKSIRQKAGIKAGDEFEFKVSGRTITIVPTRSERPLNERRGQKSPATISAVDHDQVLTSGEAKLVHRGELQIKRGESKPWRDVKHALSS